MTQPSTRPAWTVWLLVLGAATAAAGVLARVAGTYERHLAGRPVPPGWTNYAPPWADPAYHAGLLMLLAGLAVMAAALVLHARRAAGEKPLG